MADPRSLHLQGIGTLDRVWNDWLEVLSVSFDSAITVDSVSDSISNCDKGDETGIAFMACAIAKINSQVANHGMILRIDGDGTIRGTLTRDADNLDMLKDYIESI